jgi:ubiquinone biosynthesis protein COQ4
MQSQSVPDTRLHPLEALGAVRRLLSDPDDTRQVFVVLRAMRGRSGLRLFRRFQATTTGAAILGAGRSLLPRLQDGQALARLPTGSLGRRYCDFMAEEKLSSDGLVDVSQSIEPEVASDEVLLFRNRMRDAHDLTHVMTGYGRDPLGELCLLAFTHAQNGHLGVAMIVLMGMARCGRSPKPWAARAAIVEGWRHGRSAAWLAGLDWESLLPESIETLRHRLKIADPAHYLAAMS